MPHNFDGSPEGDWEGGFGELSWNEFDWQQFLRDHDREVARFLRLYDEFKEHPERLDEIAHLMGWDQEDWSVADSDDDHDSDFVSERERDDDRDEEIDDGNPYTLHRHPLYVVSRALFQSLRKLFTDYLLSQAQPVDARYAWLLGEHLRKAEMDAILAIQSLDMGDLALAVAQMKRMLAALNEALALMARTPGADTPQGEIFVEEARLRLFDLRELGLRVMNDCRDEVRRRQGDD